MKIKKKYHLKQWVKDLLLVIVVGIILGVIIIFAVKRYGNIESECDEYYGYICSTYEVEQYGKGIRR